MLEHPEHNPRYATHVASFIPFIELRSNGFVTVLIIILHFYLFTITLCFCSTTDHLMGFSNAFETVIEGGTKEICAEAKFEGTSALNVTLSVHINLGEITIKITAYKQINFTTTIMVSL